jgi:hypothetical protein
MGLENETFCNLVFKPDHQQDYQTSDSAIVIRCATEAARKNREKETEESLGSSGSTLLSNDETFHAYKLNGAAEADFDEYSFEDNESELLSLRQNGKIPDTFAWGGGVNKNQPGTTPVVSKKNPKSTVCIQDPPVLGHEIQETMMNSPVWNMYIEHLSDCVFLPCLLLGDVNPSSMSRTRYN